MTQERTTKAKVFVYDLTTDKEGRTQRKDVFKSIWNKSTEKQQGVSLKRFAREFAGKRNEADGKVASKWLANKRVGKKKNRG